MRLRLAHPVPFLRASASVALIGAERATTAPFFYGEVPPIRPDRGCPSSVTRFSTCNVLYADSHSCGYLGQTADATDMCSPLMDQIVTLAVRAPQVLFVDTGNANDRPDDQTCRLTSTTTRSAPAATAYRTWLYAVSWPSSQARSAALARVSDASK